MLGVLLSALRRFAQGILIHPPRQGLDPDQFEVATARGATVVGLTLAGSLFIVSRTSDGRLASFRRILWRFGRIDECPVQRADIVSFLNCCDLRVASEASSLR